MNNCPNCGKEIKTQQSVCECGELLRAEVTHHSNPWETETVFRARKNIKENYLATASVVLVVIATILALAWPQIRDHSKTSVTQIDTARYAAQTQAGSDIIPPPDLIQTDNANGSVTQEGVFDFTAGHHGPQTAKVRNVVRPTTAENFQPQTVASSQDSYDAQLLSDKTDQKKKSDDERSPSDCDPAATASMKRRDSAVDANESKPQPKPNSTSYILGPRGGCFFVTAGGSKKYVDRSLCGSSTVAAARQD